MNYIALLFMGVMVLFLVRIFLKKRSAATQEYTQKIPSAPPQVQHKETTLTPVQIEILRTTWQMVLPHQEQVAELFYNKLFEMDPSAKPLFKQDMKQQGDILIVTLSRIVNLIDKLDEVAPILEHMGSAHAGYGVLPAHYNTVGAALLWTLEQGLGEAYTEEVKKAWTAAYTCMSEIMINAAEQAA